ncbi:phage head closure protein [Tuberibacillus sp. Marseille-P3662]|uniref:phage head closure protein n=1 Tax=Tuberibacillus sp. Marseille-P3662 TaxID=1965358 RepID=UPI000A1CA2CC|nr:phage head closure protein [Tuberibacillus sp. Marseille-P3662]
MNPGDLKYRIVLQEFKPVRDNDGIITEKWVDTKSIWAQKQGVSGREYFAAASVNAEQTVKWHIRYRNDVTPGMRIREGDVSYDIKSVIDETGLKKELVLMTEAVVQGG